MRPYIEARFGLLGILGTTLLNQTRVKLKVVLLNPRLSSPSSDQLQLFEVHLVEYSVAFFLFDELTTRADP